MSLGEKIKKFRNQKGFSQTKLADSIGSYQKNISSYENGSVIPSAQVVKQIADTLGISADALLSENNNVISDVRILKVCRELDRLDETSKSTILTVIQAFLRDVKLRQK